jgi:hypothetical protein
VLFIIIFSLFCYIDFFFCILHHVIAFLYSFFKFVFVSFIFFFFFFFFDHEEWIFIQY